MGIPKIGDIIDDNLAFELCGQYGFDEVASQIKDNPGQFKDWKFDGASMLPDELVARIIDMDQEKFTEVALKHDLKYAYGNPGDSAAKQKADDEFEQDLLDIKLNRVLAKSMFLMVNFFGGEEWESTYSWGFARL